MFDIVGVVILVGLAAVTWWLAVRSRRTRNAVMRWTGTIASGLFAVKGGMPWKQISGFASDDDLKAMYAYLHSLAPVAGPK